ncbi:hypothetical protein Tco_0660562, partial [Tanacetum coccineum]
MVLGFSLLTSVGSVLILALMIFAALVSAHGVFRIPKDLLLDEQDRVTSTVVCAPRMAELKVSLTKVTKPSLLSDEVSIWDWSGSALDEGDEASRLVRFDEASLWMAVNHLLKTFGNRSKVMRRIFKALCYAPVA